LDEVKVISLETISVERRNCFLAFFVFSANILCSSKINIASTLQAAQQKSISLPDQQTS